MSVKFVVVECPAGDALFKIKKRDSFGFCPVCNRKIFKNDAIKIPHDKIEDSRKCASGKMVNAFEGSAICSERRCEHRHRATGCFKPFESEQIQTQNQIQEVVFAK
jgi:hypothetical protein